MNWITDINQLDPYKNYSYADYLFWKFQDKVELIKGKLLKMSPAPVQSHQQVSGNLYFAFRNFFSLNTCDVFFSPFDVVLAKGGTLKENEMNTVVQPDICIICDKVKLADGKKCVGAPDLIVEILSPATKKYDYSDKFNCYEENEVKEYWIVDPADKTVEVYTLHENKYVLHELCQDPNTTVNSALFSGLSFTWKEIFENS